MICYMMHEACGLQTGGFDVTHSLGFQMGHCNNSNMLVGSYKCMAVWLFQKILICWENTPHVILNKENYCRVDFSIGNLWERGDTDVHIIEYTPQNNLSIPRKMITMVQIDLI